MAGCSVDVVVAGAGPAGAAAATTLSRLGARTLLVDKSEFPRDKCCGDGLTTAALRRLEGLGLDPAGVASWEPVRKAKVVTPERRMVDLPLPAGAGIYAASAKRVDLDAALVRLAGRAGARLSLGNGVVGLRLEGAALTVALADGTRARTHYAVVADGAWSPVRKMVGSEEPSYLGDWQAGRQYYRDTGPAARDLWVWFERDMLPGYAWSFPLPGGVANVGYGVVRRPGRSLGELRGQRLDLSARPEIAEVLGAGARAAGPWRAWPIPARLGESTVSALGGRVLFAGDAARACDPMTGEGIAQALETGALAAAAVCSAGAGRPVAAAAWYERRLRWGMQVDDRLARFLSAILARPGGPGRALGIVDSSPRLRRSFARWMFEDYPRAAVVTPQRWSLRMFGSPGAFGGPRGS